MFHILTLKRYETFKHCREKEYHLGPLKDPLICGVITNNTAHYHFMLTMKRGQFVAADGQLHHSLPLRGRWRQPNITFCIKYESQERQMVGKRFHQDTHTHAYTHTRRDKDATCAKTSADR